MKPQSRYYWFAIITGLFAVLFGGLFFFFFLVVKGSVSMAGFTGVLLTFGGLLLLYGYLILNYQHKILKADKQFTQDASHELQTPLTVIKANAELLLQSQNVKEKEIEVIGVILNSVNRLSKINTALILLSKIEYGRFKDLEHVNFHTIFESELLQFKDLINHRALRILKAYEKDFQVEMSHALAILLVANLLQNAIRHNIEKDGFIKIEMGKNYFIVSNSGHKLKAPPEQMFKRFSRESDLDESLGLGLSIIQRICLFYGFKLEYANIENTHKLKVSR